MNKMNTWKPSSVEARIQAVNTQSAHMTFGRGHDFGVYLWAGVQAEILKGASIDPEKLLALAEAAATKAMTTPEAT